jgi:hypothetical protein
MLDDPMFGYSLFNSSLKDYGVSTAVIHVSEAVPPPSNQIGLDRFRQLMKERRNHCLKGLKAKKFRKAQSS